ncbi:hypothetical protein DFS34DRAFT_656829 [Phlyctochytrium arcticum]|nr:hypothetical protein DFS34DRAFT_656829 [Phlyctochytrium arcticum]
MTSSWETVPQGKKGKDLASADGKGVASPAKVSSGYFGALDNVVTPEEKEAVASAAQVNSIQTPKKKAANGKLSDERKSTPPPASRDPNVGVKKQAATPDTNKTSSASKAEAPLLENLRPIEQLDTEKLRSLSSTMLRQPPAEAGKALAELVETIFLQTNVKPLIPIFGKNFVLDRWIKGDPLNHLSEENMSAIVEALNKSNGTADLAGIVKHLIELQKKAFASGVSFTPNSIGYILLVQIIARENPGSFFLRPKSTKNNEGGSPADILFDQYRSQLGINPAVGNTLVWVCAQQRLGGKDPRSSDLMHPLGIEYWMKYLLPLFSSADSGARATVKRTDTNISSSASVAVQQSAVDYLDHLINCLHKQRKAHGKSKASAPSSCIGIDDYISLSRIALARQSSLKSRKKGSNLHATLQKAHHAIKTCLFPANRGDVGHIAFSEPLDAVFLSALRELGAERDAVIRDEILDALIRLIALDADKAPLHSEKKTRTTRPVNSIVLNAWVDSYQKNIIESRHLLRRLNYGIRQKPRSKPWKVILSSSALPTTLKTLQGLNQSLLTRTKKLQAKEARGILQATPFTQSEPDPTWEEIVAADSEIMALQRTLKKRRRGIVGSCFRTLLWVLFSVLMTRTFIQVLCEPGSNRSCPLEFGPIKHLERKVARHLGPIYETTRAKLVEHGHPIAAPILSQAQKTLQPVHEHWNQFKKSEQYHSMSEFGNFYVVPWVERVKSEWHDGIVFGVDHVVPWIKVQTDNGIEKVEEYTPVVRQGVAFGAQNIRKYISLGIHLVTEQIHSLWVKSKISHHPFYSQIQETAKPAWTATAYARDLISQAITWWLDGADFLWRLLEDRVEATEWRVLKLKSGLYRVKAQMNSYYEQMEEKIKED